MFPDDIEFHYFVYDLDQAEVPDVTSFFERFTDWIHMSCPQVWILGGRVVSYDSI